jgi:hypothetical protein
MYCNNIQSTMQLAKEGASQSLTTAHEGVLGDVGKGLSRWEK